MARKTENSDFVCQNCEKQVYAIAKGTIRNHCPFCLFSVHVDVLPGDRASDCHGMMRPINIIAHSKKGWQIIHKCNTCGHEQPNKKADDDDVNEITAIMKKIAESRIMDLL